MNYLTTEDGKPINDNNPLAVKDSGTAGTGITPPTGGTGILGWVSGIYNLLFGGTAKVQLSGSNVEQANGADIALKSALVAGKTSAGKGVPIQVDADGKLQVGGITVESLTATTVGIDQTTPGTTNKVVAELSGSKRKVTVLKQDASTEVLAGGYSEIQLVPISGFIGRVKTIGYYSPAIAAATGTQAISICVGAYSAYTADQIYGITGAVAGAATTIVQSTAKPSVENIVFSADYPLVLRYINNTDKAQPGTRKIFVCYEEEAVI